MPGHGGGGPGGGGRGGRSPRLLGGGSGPARPDADAPEEKGPVGAEGEGAGRRA